MFLTVDEAKAKIEKGELLHISGDESLLSQLPKGNWIGGTTPYFISNDGGVTQKENVFVSEIPCASNCRLASYSADEITKITDNAYSNGITFLILPFASEAATVYSKSAPYMDELFVKPVVGWISGFDLSEGGAAKAYNGQTGEAFSDKGVALHIELPEDKLPNIQIVNIFSSDSSSPAIKFPEDTLEVTSCTANGKEVNFAEYIKENSVDTKLPLVADYNGTFINVSIKEINEENKTVYLYAPVLADSEYRFATKIEDYVNAFNSQLKDMNDKKPVFSCNCILNYLYGDLEGKATPPFEGPVTFGEIAYQLLNQTLVFVEF